MSVATETRELKVTQITKHVFNRRNTFLQLAQSCIAVMTQQATNFTCLMIVIYTQICNLSFILRSIANRTDPFLFLKSLIVLLRRNSKSTQISFTAPGFTLTFPTFSRYSIAARFAPIPVSTFGFRFVKRSCG